MGILYHGIGHVSGMRLVGRGDRRMKIPYVLEKIVNDWCNTSCPHYGLGNVGSRACHMCEYFIADDEENLRKFQKK